MVRNKASLTHWHDSASRGRLHSVDQPWSAVPKLLGCAKKRVRRQSNNWRLCFDATGSRFNFNPNTTIDNRWCAQKTRPLVHTAGSLRICYHATSACFGKFSDVSKRMAQTRELSQELSSFLMSEAQRAVWDMARIELPKIAVARRLNTTHKLHGKIHDDSKRPWFRQSKTQDSR